MRTVSGGERPHQHVDKQVQLAIFLVRVASVVGRKGIHIYVSGHRQVSFVEHYDPSAALWVVLEVFAESIDADEGLGGRAGGEGEKATKGPRVVEGLVRWYQGPGLRPFVTLCFCTDERLSFWKEG